MRRVIQPKMKKSTSQTPAPQYIDTTKKHPSINLGVLTGNSLSSQAVSSQVLSTCECLTTVFGMGTGGTTQLSSPDYFVEGLLPQNYTEDLLLLSNILDLLS